MNKIIIIEGGDNLGKTSLIENLTKYFDYKNVMIRHCDKPPKNLSFKEVLKYQMKVFKQEQKLIFYYLNMNRKYMYHDNIIIYDRFYLGEYVYSQMFRGGKSDVLKKMLLDFETGFISHEVYLITLTADPEFFFSKEDGNSFSNKLEDKTKELELFKEAHDFSIIANKLYLKVDDFHFAEKSFRPKSEILNEVIQFIK